MYHLVIQCTKCVSTKTNLLGAGAFWIIARSAGGCLQQDLGDHAVPGIQPSVVNLHLHIISLVTTNIYTNIYMNLYEFDLLSITPRP